MRWRRRDVAITSRCAEETFSLAGDDETGCIEDVNNFKYLGRILEWSDDDWSAVRRNFRKARQVWSLLRKLLQRERADLLVSAIFYQEVVQTVLIFGAEN